jgi:hypothetical protein
MGNRGKLTKALLERIPRSIRRRLRDRVEAIRRLRPEPHRGLDQLGLAPGQVYPEGSNFDDFMRMATAEALEGFVLRRETPVASIGSCFAEEFASYMRNEGYNYVAAEPGEFLASANWGRVYTIPCFRQIVLYSTSSDFVMPVEHASAGWFDPLRDPAAGFRETREEALSEIERHRAASREAFTTARVLILTLGQNEAWVDRPSGLAWAHRPPVPLMETDGERFEARSFSFEENVNWLEDALRRLRELNVELDVLLTVSPVGSYATFCGGNAVTQSFAGKCLLRTVAERIARAVPRVWYFPSFEMALAYNPHTLMSDNRHAKHATVDRVLRLLRQTALR